MRIASLLPSATEIVCALGLRRQLVGVTHECDYPESVLGLPKVTRTLIPTEASSREIDGLVRERLRTRRALYSLDLAILKELAPDLIVTQALCDVCAVAEDEVHAAACALPGRPRVLNLEPTSVADVLSNIAAVATAAGVANRGCELVARLRSRIDAVAVRSTSLIRRRRVVLLEWIDPPFSCGHWSPELVRLAGGIEGIGREGCVSRTVSWQEVVDWHPELMLLACCGFSVERTIEDWPSLQSYPGWSELPCTRNGRVYVVDGSAYFSRPGPRLVDSLEILAHAVDREVHPLPPGLRPALPLGEAFPRTASPKHDGSTVHGPSA